jgi:hypothetical protein
MEDIDIKLYAYISSSEEARMILSHLKGIDIDSWEMQLALMEIIQTDEPADLLEKNYSAKEMVAILNEFDFRKFHPEILADIVMEESVVPEGTIRLLTEVTVKHKGERWRIHKSNSDPFPSNPHGESPDVGLKLDLATGDLYRKRQQMGKISKKNLLIIREKALQLGCKSLPYLYLSK